MWSERTQQLYDMYMQSRKEDFGTWLPETVKEHVQPYLQAKIRFVKFDIGSEYDDSGGYYNTLNGLYFYDENRNHIALDDDDHWKPEYREGGELHHELPDFDELRWDVFDGIANDIYDLGYDDKRIDLEDVLK